MCAPHARMPPQHLQCEPGPPKVKWGHQDKSSLVSLSLLFLFARVAPHCVNTLMILHAAHTRIMSAG